VLFQSGRRAAKVGDLFLLVLMLLVVFWQLRKRERKSLLVIPARGNPYLPSWPLMVLFVGSVVVCVMALVHQALAAPHGAWDAWAIWNLRARFLFLGGVHWRDAFSKAIDW